MQQICMKGLVYAYDQLAFIEERFAVIVLFSLIFIFLFIYFLTNSLIYLLIYLFCVGSWLSVW